MCNKKYLMRLIFEEFGNKLVLIRISKMFLLPDIKIVVKRDQYNDYETLEAKEIYILQISNNYKTANNVNLW